MKKVFYLIRSTEWWAYKLPPLLAVSYGLLASHKGSLFDAFPFIMLLIASIISGAIFVSIVNDFTDARADKACGKENRMESLPSSLRWLLVSGSLLPAFLFAYFFRHDLPSVLFYLGAWLAFAFYSIPPFRLKEKGIWGVLADACGAHLFPTLFVISATYHYLRLPVNIPVMLSLGVCMFSYGLRGILWHQFLDRDNDIVSGTATLATTMNPKQFRKTEWTIIVFEGMALIATLFLIAIPLAMVGLLLYIVFVVVIKNVLSRTIIIVLAPSRSAHHIVLGRFYDVFLPLAFLLHATGYDPATWLILAIHLFLFPKNLRIIFYECLASLARVRKSRPSI